MSYGILMASLTEDRNRDVVTEKTMMKLKHSVALLLSATVSVTASWSLPEPKYLSVSHWQSCTSTLAKGIAKFVCLPAQRPAECPQKTWEELTGKQLIESCD